MLATGSHESVTPNLLAVAGMSCMSPRAPLCETTFGLYEDSALMTAEMSAASTLNFFPAAMMVSSYFELKSGRLSSCRTARSS